MISKDRVVAALVAEWQAIEELLGALRSDQWDAPTALPGWSVHDTVAHLIGTESALDGQAPPPSAVDVRSLPHVRNDIGAANELWIAGLREERPDAMLRRFREITAKRRTTLESMAPEDFDAPSWTPAGRSTYGRFMRIRVFDCWMHEQDIRDAVGLPGHRGGDCAQVALSEVGDALGYIVGKRAAAPDGAAVTVRLTGAAPTTWHVVVEGRAAVVEALPGPATVAMTIDSHLFSRLVGGRVTVAERLGEIGIDGDRELGERVAEALPFTI